jgi:hypothetical protein
LPIWALDTADITGAADVAAAVQLTRWSLDDGLGAHDVVKRLRPEAVALMHVLLRLACLLGLPLLACLLSASWLSLITNEHLNDRAQTHRQPTV